MKKSTLKLTFLLLSLIILTYTMHANAALVPCLTEPCTPCDLWPLASNIVWFLLFSMAIPILTIALLTGGVIILISAGNQSLREKGKSIIWNGVIGILIAFTAYLIINTIIATLAGGKFTAGWKTVDNCPAVGTSGQINPPGGPGPTPTGTTGGTPTPSPTTGLKCSASSLSGTTQNLVSCVLSQASAAGLSVAQPLPNQLNSGCHACQAPNTPQTGCPNSGNGISCHYGGTSCNGIGNAADFSLPVSQRSTANWQKLATIVSGCGASSQRCEFGSANVGCAGGPDHIHANASGACGCN